MYFTTITIYPTVFAEEAFNAKVLWESPGGDPAGSLFRLIWPQLPPNFFFFLTEHPVGPQCFRTHFTKH